MSRFDPPARPPADPAIADGGEAPARCDFCQSTIPVEPKTMAYEGTTYRFCTDACREAMQDRERVFTTYRGHRWLDPGVAALSAKLPQGIPRNSAVLISAAPGARESELHAEIAWRALRRGEPAVFVSFQEPPISIVERFLTLGWNVLPYLESGDFHIVDCFTYRVADRERMRSRMNDWNTFLDEVAAPEVTSVRDPTNIGELESRLDDCVESKAMVDTGVVLIDSLTEFGSLVQPVRAYDYVKDVRADVAKGRFVPIFATASYDGDGDQFPHDLEYMFDGIVDLELNPSIVENALIKRLRVRKMSGALAYPEWTAYEFTSGDGLVMFDPVAEMEGPDDESEADGDSAAGDASEAEGDGASGHEPGADDEDGLEDESGADDEDGLEDESGADDEDGLEDH